ncbi:MAG TPA: DUF1684 domain-containing protein [Nocardioidaceae bacterium]|nr:DUF1684 domain-containing protein [Nocardioidaceae bacterium]
MSLTLLDWRRRVAAIYRDVRDASTPVAGWTLWRDGRAELLRMHPDSPLRSDQPLPTYAAYDPHLRFELPLLPAPAERWEAATATDGLVPFERIGRVEPPGLGSLDVWWLESYGGGVFIPLRDGTSGHTTYGGGRYLVDTVKGADLGGAEGRLVIDFNFAYNPSCAYDPAWACPLAPAGNALATAIDAGELDP